jgi:hypothetical protein
VRSHRWYCLIIRSFRVDSSVLLVLNETQWIRTTKHHHLTRCTLRSGCQDALAKSNTLALDVTLVNAHNPIAGYQFAACHGTVGVHAEYPNMIVGFELRRWTTDIHAQRTCREWNGNQHSIVLVRRRHGCLDFVLSLQYVGCESKE